MTELPTPVRPQVAVPAPRKKMIEFGTIAEVMDFAKMIQNAEGAIPKGYLGNPGKIVAAVMRGHAMGIDPMSSLVAFHTVEGKPTAGYDFWVARLKQSGYRVEWPEFGDERVTLKLTSPEGESATETWTKDRAVRAGLWNARDPWKKYPSTMLAARCVTSLGRRFAAEVMFGCMTPDEIEEVAPADFAEVTSKPEVAAAADRLVAALGAPVDDSAAAVQALARECADMAKAAGMTRDNLYELMAQHNIEAGRLSEKTLDQLRTIRAALGQLGDAHEAEPPAGDDAEGAT